MDNEDLQVASEQAEARQLSGLGLGLEHATAQCYNYRQLQICKIHLGSNVSMQTKGLVNVMDRKGYYCGLSAILQHVHVLQTLPKKEQNGVEESMVCSRSEDAQSKESCPIEVMVKSTSSKMCINKQYTSRTDGNLNLEKNVYKRCVKPETCYSSYCTQLATACDQLHICFMHIHDSVVVTGKSERNNSSQGMNSIKGGGDDFEKHYSILGEFTPFPANWYTVSSIGINSKSLGAVQC